MRRFILALLVTAATACADNATCDDGQVLSMGLCIPDPGDSAVPDAGMDAAIDSAPVCEPDAGGAAFGAPCMDGEMHSDCSCPAPYCAIMPGTEDGVCTITGCGEDETLCPDGWRCLDLTGIDPTIPTFCVEG